MIRKKIILLAVVMVVAAGGFVGYRLYNKPHRSASDEKGIAVTASQLCGDYETDEMLADKKYIGQLLEVSGTITEITQNQENSTVITLTGNSMCNVQCTLATPHNKLKKGDSIVVKGFCTGYLLTEVKLNRCVIKKLAES
jgi:hypothetical protein